MLGRIHSIDTFSTLDGPGIRTVVFMQGCMLKCKYCHNPDTWALRRECSLEYTPDELMRLIIRCKPYYDSSGGGITISGGEPLLQSEFVRDIFIHCQNAGISTAFDSSLYIRKDAVTRVLPYTNLVLADIKQMDNVKSLNLVGASNESNLNNLRYINKQQVPIWIRYVVVPGWTDDIKDIQAMAEFIEELEYVQRIDLLPYHSLGAHKWNLLGLKFELETVKPPPHDLMLRLHDIIENISQKPVVIHQ